MVEVVDFQTVYKAFSHRKDLEQYAPNSLLLWAFQMRYGIEDIETFASNYLTDGSDDKKCDLIWVNRDDGYAIIAQSHHRQDFEKGEAPANKASDLNTAVAWVLGEAPLEEIPERLRSAVKDLRDAIETGEISTLYLYYFHNLQESANVEKELARVKGTADAFPRGQKLNIVAEEIGQREIVDWYESIETPIRIADDFEIDCDQGYEIIEKRWKALSTFIPASEIYRYFKKYDTKLFSGNPRGYLGLIQSDQNINYGIRRSAETDPDNFWVYHNGISIIVHGYEWNGKRLRFSGVSIVNGAQTTGAIGNAEKEPAPDVKIPVRFIQANDQEILKLISRYNNSQNKMLPADFRSGDTIQNRLVEEFAKFPGSLKYLGGRRGGEKDAIARDPNLVASDTVAQSLTAFHGNPDMAYKYKGRIWTENGAYSRIFNELTTSRHILFVYSLHTAILEFKQSLVNLAKAGSDLTASQRSALDFLSQRGSVFLTIFAISSCMETFLGRVILDKFSLFFKDDSPLATYMEYWKPIIESVLSFSNTLNEGLRKYSFTVEDVNTSVGQFSELIQSTAAANKPIYETFASNLAVK